MKTNDDLTLLSAGELEKRKNMLKTLTVTWAVILIILAGTAIIVTLRQGYSVFTVLPMVFLPGLIMSRRQLRAVREELRRRELNG